MNDTGDAGRALAARLYPYVSGGFKGLFDGPTSTTPDGHLVVYTIKDLPEELKLVGTLLILDAIWRTVSTSHHAGTRQDRPPTHRQLCIRMIG